MTTEHGEDLSQIGIEIKKQTEEFKILKDELEKYKKEVEEFKNVTQSQLKSNNATKAKVNKRSPEEMRLLEDFFNKYIVSDKDSVIRTLDMITRVNEVLKVKPRFNKFELSQFMKNKGISKKRKANRTYYLNVKMID